jgi:hypothetical protein
MMVSRAGYVKRARGGGQGEIVRELRDGHVLIPCTAVKFRAPEGPL